MATVGTTAEGNKTVVLRYVEEVWNRHNLDTIDELVSPGYVNHAATTDEYRHGRARRIWEWPLRLPQPPLRRRGRGRRRGDGGGKGHVHQHERGQADGHSAHEQALRRAAVALVPRGGRQVGGTLGGERRPRHATAAGNYALLTRPIHQRCRETVQEDLGSARNVDWRTAVKGVFAEGDDPGFESEGVLDKVWDRIIAAFDFSSATMAATGGRR